MGYLYFSVLLIVLFPNLMHVYTYYFFQVYIDMQEAWGVCVHAERSTVHKNSGHWYGNTA